MLASFQVGEIEKHHVEVYSRFFGIPALEVVTVDGVEVLRKTKFPIWLTDHLQFEIGDRERHTVELRYNTLSLTSRAYVDGRLHIGCLFPQVIGYNALILASLAFLLAAVGFVAAALH
jgi:hypothetical protein